MGKVLDMKRLIVLLVLLGAVLSGCGMVSTYEQRERRYRNLLDISSRQIVDDWDSFWFADKPSRMAYYYVYDAD